MVPSRPSVFVMFRKRLRIIDNSSKCKMRHVLRVGVAKSRKIVEELAILMLRGIVGFCTKRNGDNKTVCVELSMNLLLNDIRLN